MSDPTSAPVSTPAGATPPFGPIHPLIAAVRLDAVAAQLAAANGMIDRGVLKMARDHILCAADSLREIGRAAGCRTVSFEYISGGIHHAVDLLDEGSAGLALQRLAAVSDSLVSLAREFRQESDRLQHQEQGDRAVMRDLSARVVEQGGRTPVGQMPAMDPLAAGGYESQAAAQDVARGAVRASRRRWNPVRYVTADGAWAAFQGSVLGAVAIVIILAALNAAGVL